MSLPYKKKLVYIESDGNQFVDTGVLVSSETFERAEMDIAVVSTTRHGFYIGSGWMNSALCVANFDSNKTFIIGRFSSIYTYADYVIGKRTNIVFDRETVTVNGISLSIALTETSEISFRIFGSSATSFRSAMRFYSAKVVCGGKTILDLIPVLDTNDVPCIYNKVNGELYYNTGTGQFTYEYNLQVLTSRAVATRFNPLGRKPKPYAYELEYLEATGTQYARTGFYFADSSGAHVEGSYFEADFRTTARNGYLFQVYGRIAAATWLAYLGDYAASYTLIRFGTQIGTSGSPSPMTRTVTARVTATTAVVNGVSYSREMPSTFYMPTQEVQLFRYPQDGKISSGRTSFFKAKGYSGEIDLIAVEDRNGIACFYDKITDKLIYSETDPFIAGPRKE